MKHNQEEIEQLNEAEEWLIDDSDHGERIDKFLADALDGQASRSQVQQWVKENHVMVNDQSVKPNYKLHPGDRVRITIPDPQDVNIAAEPIALEVVYEDSDVIVVNKPRGMVVHPAPGHYSGTLVNALLHHCKDLSGINGILRPGIVHRIDKDTSGLLMAAKNDLAHTSLAEQLQQHTVIRKYTALVHGIVSHLQGTIDAPIGRDAKDRKMYTVTERNSRSAVTHFIVLEQFADTTLLELQLETGRTHQIRVHMKYIGHPLVGDPMYGMAKRKTRWIEGQALHAGLLGFTHPRTGKDMLFEAPLPEDMRALIDMLRSTSLN